MLDENGAPSRTKVLSLQTCSKLLLLGGDFSEDPMLITEKSVCSLVLAIVWSVIPPRLLAQAKPQDPHLPVRVVHSDPSKYRNAPQVHGGAGTLSFTGLLGPEDFNVNLIFLHRGILQPKSGIGHHFHNQMEEMFVIFDNRAQFTIDGRTAELAGPVGAPCRMGSRSEERRVGKGEWVRLRRAR